jgi:hypothetical protein
MEKVRLVHWPMNIIVLNALRKGFVKIARNSQYEGAILIGNLRQFPIRLQ